MPTIHPGGRELRAQCQVQSGAARAAGFRQSGALSIFDNGSAMPTVSALSGSAVDFQWRSQTVRGSRATGMARQTATYTLDVTSCGACTGPVAFTCSGTTLPGTRAVPAPLSATPNARTTFQATFGTSASAKRVSMWRSDGKQLLPPRGGTLRTVVPVMLLFAPALTERAANRRPIEFAASARLLVLFAMALAACGRSSSSPLLPGPGT